MLPCHRHGGLVAWEQIKLHVSGVVFLLPPHKPVKIVVLPVVHIEHVLYGLTQTNLMVDELPFNDNPCTKFADGFMFGLVPIRAAGSALGGPASRCRWSIDDALASPQRDD